MCSLKESSVVQKHLSQQGYLCSPGAGIITIIIHIDFTDGIYWLFWNRDRIQCHPEIFLWELFCLKKTPVSPKMTFIEKGSLRLVLVGLRKVLPEISHERNLLFWNLGFFFSVCSIILKTVQNLFWRNTLNTRLSTPTDSTYHDSRWE